MEHHIHGKATKHTPWPNPRINADVVSRVGLVKKICPYIARSSQATCILRLSICNARATIRFLNVMKIAMKLST